MSNIEERLAALEASVQQQAEKAKAAELKQAHHNLNVLKAIQKTNHRQFGQVSELVMALGVALKELAELSTTDVNSLILLLERHLQLRAGEESEPPLEFAEALVAALRAMAR